MTVSHSGYIYSLNREHIYEYMKKLYYPLACFKKIKEVSIEFSGKIIPLLLQVISRCL